jgi:FHA domain/IPT/TIG domain
VTESVTPNQPALIVSGGPNDGLSLPLAGPIGERVLGSGAQCHMRLESPAVAEAHARLIWNNAGVFLYDNGTRGGTYVNGEKIEDACLADGDRVFLGAPGSPDSVRIVVQLPTAPGEIWGGEVPGEQATSPPPPAPHRATAADYATDVSIGASSARSVATPARTAPRRAPAPKELPLGRVGIVAGAAVVLGLGAFLVLRHSGAGAPALMSLTPPKAEPGQTVLLHGSGFDPNASGDEVQFGDKRAEVSAATDEQLTVTVPTGLTAQDAKSQYQVRVRARGKRSNALFFQVYLGPRVTRLEPDVAMPGDEVKAIGENFSKDMTVSVDNSPAQVLEMEPGALRFKVPELAVTQGKTVAVRVQAGSNAARASDLILGTLPLVEGLSPSRGVAGDRVTIKGRGFDPTPGATAVTFGGREALVLSVAPSELVAVVPGAGSVSGQAEVSVGVKVGGSASAVTPAFSMLRASAAAFTPRFFPVPWRGGERAAVETELGPALLLGGQAEAASVAERATRVAAALNAMLERAARAPIRLEVRAGAQPEVAEAGGAVLVQATPEDAAAYASHPSTKALAGFWAALLQDYATLFGQHQRPTRLLELTTRARVLVELYSDAEHRAGEGGGVPPALIAGLSPTQTRALADLALNVPAEGGGSAGAAVAGEWAGTMKIGGEAERQIELSLRLSGSSLDGTFTTRSGKIAADVPLSAASYERGVLSFTVTLGGRPIRFNGTLDGRAVTGRLLSESGAALGDFTLRFVD